MSAVAAAVTASAMSVATANAFATPNGIVVVHPGFFDVFENEAQLSFILSHEVSHAVQEHGSRESQHLEVRRGLLKIAAAVAAKVKEAAATKRKVKVY